MPPNHFWMFRGKCLPQSLWIFTNWLKEIKILECCLSKNDVKHTNWYFIWECQTFMKGFELLLWVFGLFYFIFRTENPKLIDLFMIIFYYFLRVFERVFVCMVTWRGKLKFLNHTIKKSINPVLKVIFNKQ